MSYKFIPKKLSKQKSRHHNTAQRFFKEVIIQLIKEDGVPMILLSVKKETPLQIQCLISMHKT